MRPAAVPLGIALGVSAAAALLGVPSASATESPRFDASAAWARFLDEADLASAYPVYGLVDQVGYRGGEIDPDGCEAHAEALAQAVEQVPVSLFVRHAAMLCASAAGDEAAAERELAAVAALSRHALAQSDGTSLPAPIRVLAPADVYALLFATGLEFRYEFYEDLFPLRDFPLHVAALDPASGQERHLVFDFVDVASALSREGDYVGYPFQRRLLADQFIEAQAGAGEIAAIDFQAAREAAGAATPEAKRDAFAPGAARGGLQSAMGWLILCVRSPFDGCGDGYVDALLPYAEEKHALHLVLLALAHAEGVGVERDATLAERFLDAADARWPRRGGTVAYASLVSTFGDKPFPAALQARLDAAWRDGNAEARLVSLGHAAGLEGAVLDARALADLALPALNARGQGFALLATYHDARGDKASALEAVRGAAAAGHAWNQAVLASYLRFDLPREQPDAPAADPARVRRLLVEAAHGGDAWAARRLAYDAMEEGDWVAAKAWLLGPGARGDVHATLDYAELHEVDRPGVPGNLAHAIDLYRTLADESDSAEARRRLARMAMAGTGMDKDFAQARAWLEEDAVRGDAESQAMLGLALLNGFLGDVDESAAMRWLEPAIEAKDATAVVDYGNWLFYTRDTPESRAQARELWAVGDAEGFLTASNNLAWVLCTAQAPDERAPARGLEIALRMQADYELDSSELDTVAACHAATGDYEAAQRAQQSAIEALASVVVAETDAAARQDIASTLARFDERLALYRAGSPFVEVSRE